MIPEFKKEYYVNQIELMKKRYSVIFKENKLNWDKFYDSLNLNYYLMWSFLCGLEEVIKCTSLMKTKKEKEEYIYENTKKRIFKMTQNEKNIKSYLNNL